MESVRKPHLFNVRDYYRMAEAGILRPRADEYGEAHPGPKDVLLLIEVADTSIDKDRGKAALYGSARIPEYWIVNLAGDCIEVHRQPITGGYRQVTAFARGQTIPIKAFRGKKLAVNAILGKKSKR